MMPEEVHLSSDWPGHSVLSTLVRMAVPLFIFAATICRFIDDDHTQDPKGQLAKVLQYREATAGSNLGQLSATYLPVLDQLVRNAGPNRSRILDEFRGVIGPIVLRLSRYQFHPLALLNHTQEFICAKLNRLHSVLDIPSKARILLLEYSTYPSANFLSIKTIYMTSL